MSVNTVNSHPTLIVGDWHSWCGVCGRGADPDERTHRRVLPGWPGRPGQDGTGCGVEWTHVRADVTSRLGADEQIREMRPDLTLLQVAG